MLGELSLPRPRAGLITVGFEEPPTVVNLHSCRPIWGAMQKLAKRAAQAQRQATRRAIKQIGHDDAGKRSQARQGLKSAVKEVRENLEAARRARREDWELGPLAPKRDLGFNNYGAAQEGARQDWTHGNSNREKPQRIEQRCAWAGGVGQLNLAPQDRVVILDGPDKGKIDRIQRVQLASGTVTLENYHRVCVSPAKSSCHI